MNIFGFRQRVKSLLTFRFVAPRTKMATPFFYGSALVFSIMAYQLLPLKNIASQRMMSEAEETKKKIDPYTRSRNALPLKEDAVIIAGTSN